MTDVARIPAGQVLFEEGSAGRHMFVLLEGELTVSKVREGVKVDLARIGPGSTFGELGLLESAPRSATVIATQDSTVLPVNSAALLRRLSDDPIFGLRLLQQLAEKVRVLSDLVADLASRLGHGGKLTDEATKAEYEPPGYL